MTVDLTLIITFHREGILAHAALKSYLLSRNLALQGDINVQVVLVLDNADAATVQIVRGHPDLRGDEVIIETAVGDSALARNVGIGSAKGTYVCTLDGDDLISRDYLQKHVEFAGRAPGRSILHPEVVASFGVDHRFTPQLDPQTMPFSPDMMISGNPWVSAVFARRDVFLEVPYVACFPRQTGFGYEDWHWNCQTMANGYEHRVVPGTAYFYRLKAFGSINTDSNALLAVMPPSDLFGRWERP